MLLELKNITKKFGEVEVLKGINIQLHQGKILGLVGENGAGKSTMMNILGGIHQPSSGEMSLNSVSYTPQNPIDALQNGIAFIHQELNLFTNLSVLENLYLNNFPSKNIAGLTFIDKKTTQEKAQHLLNEVGLEVNTGALVETLSPAQKQLLEIAKALGGSPQIIIFDEPTTALTRFETEKLFGLINRLKSQGIAMIYISHNLEDVKQLSDEIVVLRDGTFINKHLKTDGFSIKNIINEMIGRDLNQLFPLRNTQPKNEVLMEIEGLAAAPLVKNISFKLNAKEVLGFYGLVGAGRSETARAIYGLEGFQAGKITFKNEQVASPSPKFWIQNNLAFLTEDRREEGLFLEQNIQKNITLAALPDFTKYFFRWINYAKANQNANEKAEATKLKFNSLANQKAGTLSGGNQQKVVLSKWLLTNPNLLIIDEPTKGIDVGAKYEIYGLINQMVENDAGVIVISSEIEELRGICDRILVFNQGKITAEFTKDNFDRNAILQAALHHQNQD
jgi:ribose transport system ATP-binding protein